MVLVRSENGQLLMIPQQALAQMQAHAQAQPQSTMAPRPATPTGAPPVQISTVQVSACMMSRLMWGGPSSAWLSPVPFPAHWEYRKNEDVFCVSGHQGMQVFSDQAGYRMALVSRSPT